MRPLHFRCSNIYPQVLKKKVSRHNRLWSDSVSIRGTVGAPTLHAWSTSHTKQTSVMHSCPSLPPVYSEGNWPDVGKLLASSPLLLSISLSSISSPCSCCCRSWRRCSFSSASFCCWYSRCCFRHLILLFWNHTLTYNKRYITFGHIPLAADIFLSGCFDLSSVNELSSYVAS